MKNLDNPKIFFKLFKKLSTKKHTTRTKRTTYIEKKVIDVMCGKVDYSLAGHYKKEGGAEFLRIDFNLFKSEVSLNKLDKSGGNIPLISIEHENTPIRKKYVKENRVFFNFNKLFALTSKLKVLIGYVKVVKSNNPKEEINQLKKEVVKKIVDYVKSIKHQRETKFLIILGDYYLGDYNNDYNGYIISEEGKIISEEGGKWKEYNP